MVIIAAILMFVEEWLWEHLAALMARLAKTAAVRALEAWLAGLPPYGAIFTAHKKKYCENRIVPGPSVIGVAIPWIYVSQRRRRA